MRHWLVVLAAAVLVAGCSEAPAAGRTPRVTDPPSVGPGDVATPSAPVLTPLKKPTAPWPAPAVTGAPADDAPLADRIRFAIAERAQVAAGKAAKTTVSCPGLDDVETTGGDHRLGCTVTYAGKTYTGILRVDARRYVAGYRFTSDSVPITKAKVLDAVLRAADRPARITCTMDAVAVLEHTDPNGIGCDVTTTGNAVVPYTARVSGDGKVYVTKA